MEFAVAIGVTAALSAGLALLILLADALLLNYGDCNITINKEKQLTVRGGGHLLAALADNKVFIPSACGGRGSCGLCKVKVLEGGGQLLPTEEPFLTKEEVEEDIRLSCQVKVRNDVIVEIPPELLSLREFLVTVEKMIDLNYDTKRIRLRFAQGDEISFRPGQYVQLVAPPYGERLDPIYRAYSVASPASEKNWIELIIHLVPGGICTTYVFEMMKEGDTARINGPYGKFGLSDTDAEILFVAGATGIAPIISILHEMKEKQIARKATFFYGANTLADLYLVDEMRQFEKDVPAFTFVPCIATPAPGDNWQGEVGLVTEVLDRHVADATAMEGYLCGGPGMIDVAIEILKQKGMPEAHISYDKFA